MKKNYPNKSMGPEDGGNKSAKLRCIRGCVAPPFGSFKEGDIVTEPEAVAYLRQNDFYFIEIKED